jgi:hypothetical protein
VTSDQSAKQWQVLIDADRAFSDALANFVRGWSEDSQRILKSGLRSHIMVALAIIRALPVEESIQLLPDLLYYARSVHGHLEDVRQTILSIPKDRLIREIELAAKPLLSTGDDEDYRRFLELYLRIDSQLALRLARAAASASDLHIREIGEEFVQKLGG